MRINFKLPLKLKIRFLLNNCLQTTIFVVRFLNKTSKHKHKYLSFYTFEKVK